MFEAVLKSVGKSTLIVAGAGYGLARGLRLAGEPQVAGLEDPSGRLENLEERLDRIENSLASLARPATAEAVTPLTGFVTREELADAVDRATARVRAEVERKFEAQSLAVSGLRAMISQTDELLQKVLEGLESASHSRSEAGHDNFTERLMVERVS